MRERRRAHRRRLTGTVRLRLAGRDLQYPAADVSVSGVGVLLPADDLPIFGPKPSGEVGHCRIESPDLPTAIDAYVSVMRIRRIGTIILLGLRFESIGDEDLATIEAYQQGS